MIPVMASIVFAFGHIEVVGVSHIQGLVKQFEHLNGRIMRQPENEARELHCKQRRVAKRKCKPVVLGR